MEKGGIRAFLGLFLLVSIVMISVFAYNVQGKNQAKIDASVSAELQNTGKARVVVTLKDTKNLGIKYMLTSAAAVREKTIDIVGDEKVKHKFDSFNGFSASISEEDLDRLRNDERVESIEYDVPVMAFLTDSVGIVNATRTWATQINGTNLTGAGQTVCVLDTGVNYSHADLGGCTIENLSLSGNNESNVVESDHNYSNSYDNTWTINYTGFEKIAVHFVNISTEGHWDFITVYDGNNKTLATYSGSHTDVWSPYSEGDTIYVRLKSDSTVNNYGFYIDLVLNGTTETTYNWSNCSKVIHGWDLYNNDPNPIDDHYVSAGLQGHGTHVTGIVAASGSIMGVAPEAKIVSVKVLNNLGNGYGGDIARAIEWCTENSEAYNISVISMSLGTNTSAYGYSSHCDASYSYYRTAINAAVAKNISVVIATGNDGNTTHISAPACIANATAVGWLNKDDTFHSNSNRNGITDLVAPGTSITSTSWTGSSMSMSGTSMSTPHVAAAFALIRQFYLLQSNRILKPSEIEDALNDTGKSVYDSGSGLSYSRINIYAAAASFNNAPSVTILSPANTTYDTQEILINITNSSDAVYVWWFNGTENVTYTGPENYNFSYGSHTIYAYSNDTFNAMSNTSVTFAISNDTNIEFEEPTTSGNKSQDYILVNVSSTDASLDTILVYLYNSSQGLINSSNSSTSPLFVNFTGLAEGTYYLNATANDTSGNPGATETRTIILDTTSPTLTIVSPINGSWHNSLRFNVSLSEPGGMCWAVYNSSNITLVNNSVANTHFYHINASVGETTNNTERNVTFYCNDTAGNINNTEISFFGVDTTDPDVDLVSPADAYSTTSTSITFTFQVTDTHDISTCDLIIDSSSEYTWTSVDKGEDESHAESGLSVASHDWSVDCIDEAGNTGSSNERDFSVTDTGGSGGDDGDDGGGDTTTTTTTTTTTEDYEEVIYRVTDEMLKNGTSKKVREEDRFTFKVYNRSHTLAIMNVTSNSIRLRLRSDPVYFTLNVSENKSFDLNKDNYYDFFVHLHSIVGIVANLTIKEIYVAYDGNYTLDLNETITSDGAEEDTGWDFTWPTWLKFGWKTYLYIGIGIIVLAAAGVVGVILFKRRQHHLKLHGHI